jgi:hypothetical protein
MPKAAPAARRPPRAPAAGQVAAQAGGVAVGADGPLVQRRRPGGGELVGGVEVLGQRR